MANNMLIATTISVTKVQKVSEEPSWAPSYGSHLSGWALGMYLHMLMTPSSVSLQTEHFLPTL